MSTIVSILAVLYYVVYLFFTPFDISNTDIIIIDEQISIAQSMKKRLGIKRIIGSVLGLNNQFALPGKNI